MLEMDHDGFGEIINGPNTYEVIRNKLSNNKPVVIGWTDEDCTHYDILFTYNPHKEEYNSLQRGLRSWYLYVSIIGLGAFGFNTDSAKYPEYIGEKLNVTCTHTAEKLAELINNIIKEV